MSSIFIEEFTFENPDLAKWLHRVNIPTLLIWGEDDGLVPPRFGEAYQHYIPKASLVVIPKAGHAPFEEQPDALLAAFDDFLSRQISSSASLNLSHEQRHRLGYRDGPRLEGLRCRK